MATRSRSTDPAVMHVARTRVRGFTFVELVVAVAFLGILAALVVYALQGSRRAAHQPVCVPPQCGNPVVLTDSFEPPVVHAVGLGASREVTAPRTFGAWKVERGTVAIVSTTRWNLQTAGSQSVELVGPAPDAIARTVGGLVAGHTYKLGIQYAVDTCAPTARVRVQIGDLDTTVTATNPAPQGYRTAVYSFTAPRSGGSLLTFTGTSTVAGCGIVVDNILVTS